MREVSLDRLRTLVMVAKLGSFSKASIALNLAPPTISLHISELETRIGGTLLIRAKVGVKPTSAGIALINRATRLLADAELALIEAQRQVQGLTGRVRISSSTGVIAHTLPLILETLKLTHPDIDVEVSVLTSHEAMKKINEGELEIGIVALPQPNIRGIKIEPWREDPILAFIPASWNVPDEITPSWLYNKTLILNERSTHLSQLTYEWFSTEGYSLKPRIEINYNDALKSLVAAGYGATLLPHEESAPAPDNRIKLRQLSPPLWRSLGIAYRDGGIEQATINVLDALRV